MNSSPVTYDPNPILAWIYERAFKSIDIDEDWVAQVRRADDLGTVVYVLRNLSFVDFLALDYLTKRFDLPEVRYANDLGLGILEPFGRGWFEALKKRSHEDDEAALGAAIQGGWSATVFLKRPPHFLKSGARGQADEGDRMLRLLFDLQAKSSDPILLVPQVFLWSKGPDADTSLLNPILGPREWPGKVRSVAQLVANYGKVTMRAGEPIHLRTFLDARPGEDPVLSARRLSSVLLRRLERERRAVIGPSRKSPERVRDQILKSPKLQQVIRDLAGEGAKERQLLESRAMAILRELGAELDMGTVAAFGAAMQKMFKRLFSNLEIDRRGLDALREIMKTGTVIFLPSHKSHLDYLVLSYVLFSNHLQVPMIAAGNNLNFFPIGPLFRKSGAFFIRRSFKGDRLYSAVVDAYLRRLLLDGLSIEFFVEGGRSRTGKLLSPKLGLLSVIVTAALEITSRPIVFVPVSVSYERMVEERSYAQELAGREKRKEGLRSLLSSASYLQERYGQVSVQFGEPLTLEGVMREYTDGDTPLSLGKLSPPKRRALIQRLAYRTMNEINRVTAVTAGSLVASALLAEDGGLASAVHLGQLVGRLGRLLVRWGARFAGGIISSDTGKVRDEAVRSAIELFVRAGHISVTLPGRTVLPGEALSVARQNMDSVFVVPEEHRMMLNLPKNLIVHFFVTRGVIAASLLRGAPPGEAAVSTALLRERAQWLSRLLKYEFQFRADRPFDQIFDETIAQMQTDGEISVDGTMVLQGVEEARECLLLHYRMLATFFEGYRIAARAATLLMDGALNAKEFAKRAIPIGEEMLAKGEIRRRESISRPVFENALSAFVDLGYLERENGKLVLAESFDSDEGACAIEANLAPWATVKL